MFRYVKVDADGLPERDAWVENHEAPEEDMIEIPVDFNLSNRKYVDGEWKYIIEPEPEPEPEPTDDEMIMDAIATVYEAVLENKE